MFLLLSFRADQRDAFGLTISLFGKQELGMGPCQDGTRRLPRSWFRCAPRGHTSGMAIRQPSPRVGPEPLLGTRWAKESRMVPNQFRKLTNRPVFLVHRSSISRPRTEKPETPGVPKHQEDRRVRISSVMTNEAQLPKLDVAGSIPVSRSMFSTTYSYTRLMRLMR